MKFLVRGRKIATEKRTYLYKIMEGKSAHEVFQKALADEYFTDCHIGRVILVEGATNEEIAKIMK